MADTDGGVGPDQSAEDLTVRARGCSAALRSPCDVSDANISTPRRPLRDPRSTRLPAQAFVQELLQQMQSRFSQMSETIISRIDEMGGRIDELESSISDLMDQAGVEAGDDGEKAADDVAS